MWWLLIIWGVILTVVCVLYLLVCTDRNTKGCLGSFKNFMFFVLPDYLAWASGLVCCNCFTKCFKRAITYLLFTPNRMVQYLYCVLAVGGFAIYVWKGFPLAPCKYVPAYHKYIGSLLILVCYYSYYKACVVDPGRIVPDTHGRALSRFKFD